MDDDEEEQTLESAVKDEHYFEDENECFIWAAR